MDELDEALQLVRDEGGRTTATRRIVLEALARHSDEGVTAERLAEIIRSEHPSFSESTVYRSLECFERVGIASHSHLGHGPALWRRAVTPRWYAVCSACGAALDVDSPLMDRLARELRRRSGFRMDGHFAITGVCSACAGQP